MLIHIGVVLVPCSDVIGVDAGKGNYRTLRVLAGKADVHFTESISSLFVKGCQIPAHSITLSDYTQSQRAGV